MTEGPDQPVNSTHRMRVDAGPSRFDPPFAQSSSARTTRINCRLGRSPFPRKEDHDGNDWARYVDGTHGEDPWGRGSRSRPDPGPEQATRCPVAVRSIHCQRRGKAQAPGVLGPPQRPGAEEYPNAQGADRRGSRAGLLLNTAVHGRRGDGGTMDGYGHSATTTHRC